MNKAQKSTLAYVAEGSAYLALQANFLSLNHAVVEESGKTKAYLLSRELIEANRIQMKEKAGLIRARLEEEGIRGILSSANSYPVESQGFVEDNYADLVLARIANFLDLFSCERPLETGEFDRSLFFTATRNTRERLANRFQSADKIKRLFECVKKRRG